MTTSPPPRSPLGRSATAEQVTSGIDLSGKTVLITGVNSGLGLESMRVLASRGAHVIGAARSLEKAEAACKQVAGSTTPVACELSDFASVAACADEVARRFETLDVLLCNAGIMALPQLEQRHGLELQFVTNHLGHFLLTTRLLGRVKAAPAGRVVVVSSGAHLMGPRGGIDFDNLTGERGYDGWRFYGQSKLANILMARELDRRLEGTSATANALHPGVIETNLGRHFEGRPTLMSLLARPFRRTVPQGAATQCWLAAHPDLEGVGGHYFASCKPSFSSRASRDPDKARRLWELSEELVADA